MKVNRIILLLILWVAAASSYAQDTPLKELKLDLGAQSAVPGGYVSLTDAFGYTGLEGYYYSDRIDFVYLHGKTTGANLLIPTHDAGFRAFSSALLGQIQAWNQRNKGQLIKLNPRSAKVAFDAVKTTGDLALLRKETQASVTRTPGYEPGFYGPGERLTELEPGDAILFKSLDNSREAIIYIQNIENLGTRASMTVLLKYKL